MVPFHIHKIHVKFLNSIKNCIECFKKIKIKYRLIIRIISTVTADTMCDLQGGAYNLDGLMLYK